MLRYFAAAVSRAGAAAEILPGHLPAISGGEGAADVAFDAAFAFGGTGTGRDDRAVTQLAERGSVTAHGIAIEPGATAAFGHLHASRGGVPVLLLPGAFDAAFAAWLLLGARMVAGLAGATARPDAPAIALGRKIASPLGITGIVLVSRRDGLAWPLSRAHFSLADLARADGWVRIEADHEGYPEGAAVPVGPMP